MPKVNEILDQILPRISQPQAVRAPKMGQIRQPQTGLPVQSGLELPGPGMNQEVLNPLAQKARSLVGQEKPRPFDFTQSMNPLGQGQMNSPLNQQQPPDAARLQMLQGQMAQARPQTKMKLNPSERASTFQQAIQQRRPPGTL